jgi:hypothetical protein
MNLEEVLDNDPADMEIVGQVGFPGAPILMLAGKSLVDLVFPKYAKSKKRSFNPTYLVFIIWGIDHHREYCQSFSI